MKNKEAFSLGKPENVIFKEPHDGLDESWFGAIVGTFGDYRDFLTVAQSFRNAANCLIETHKKNYYEYEILDPVLYLYRHTAELYLKAIINIPENNLDVRKRFGHNLNKLYIKVEDLVKGHDHKLPDKAKNIIHEFNEVDCGSFSFRYNGVWSKDEFWIGYENLYSDINWLFDGFEKIYSLLSDRYKKTPEFTR